MMTSIPSLVGAPAGVPLAVAPNLARASAAAGGSGGVTPTLPPTPTPTPVVGGIAFGTVGVAGTPFANMKLVAGDDFNAMPTRWNGRNPTGTYMHSAISKPIHRMSNDEDSAFFIDPSYRGDRHQSPVDLGVDRLSVSGGVALMAPAVPDASLLAFLPSNFNNGAGVTNVKPPLISSTLCTAPSFMLSAQADFAYSYRVRLPAGAQKGWFPSAWDTTLNWPNSGEIDGPEWIKNADGTIVGRLNIIGNNFDGGPVVTDRSTVSYPANKWFTAVVRKEGSKVIFYDDSAVEGTFAIRATSTASIIARVRRAHDIRLQMAVNTNADGTSSLDLSQYNGLKGIEFDNWMAWVPEAAGDNLPTTILLAVNTTPGGSWAATFPSLASISGGKAGVEEVTAAWDNTDGPGYITRDQVARIPGGMTLDMSARTVAGTVPMTEGGAAFLLFTYAFNDGTPVKRTLLPFNVAPAVQNLAASTSVATGAAFSKTIAYTDFHSGNLGPHTYQVTKVSGGAYINIAGNGTGQVTLTGNAPGAAETVTLSIACTNSIGQTTTATQSFAVVEGVSYLNWTEADIHDFTDQTTITQSNRVASRVESKKASGGTALVAAGVAGAITTIDNVQNGKSALRITKNTADVTAVPRLLAEGGASAALSKIFQGNDKPHTVIIAIIPRDTQTGFPYSASYNAGATLENMGLVRRAAAASSIRKAASDGSAVNDANFGTGMPQDVPRIIAVRHNGTTVEVWDNSLTKTTTTPVSQDTAAISANAIFRLGAAATANNTTPGALATVQSTTDYLILVTSPLARSDADIVQSMRDMAASSNLGITLS